MTNTASEVEAQAPPPATEALAAEMPAEQPKNDAKAEEKPKRGKKQKAPKEKKPTTASHPPYFQMIKEAIVALNEKGGSSPYAIAKYMEQKHKAVLPSNFRKILGLQLKNSVSKGKLIKIKASYKLSETGKRRDKSTTTKTTKAARANAAKEPTTKKRKPKSRSVSKIANPPINNNPTVRRSKRSATATKLRQLKTIKSPVANKAKKAA